MGIFFSTSMICTSVYKLIKSDVVPAEVYAVSCLVDIFAYSFCFVLPKAIETFVEVRNCSRRIESFLNSAGQKENLFIRENVDGVQMKHASVSWNSKELTSVLKVCTFKVERGDFCMIMGPVGSGKSALLYSILGELHLIGGEIQHCGKIAFVPQSPWIIAGTIKENIVFGRAFDPDLYSRVLKVACLEVDLKNLENGDSTAIADNGSSLSGGQKSRISLARALYSTEAEIFLFDDVLSAVDNKVGKAIFKGLRSFLGKKKTCLFISHQIQFAKYCSKVMILNRGSIKYFGSYEDLIQNKGMDFVNELVAYHGDKKEAEEQQSTLPDETKLMIVPPAEQDPATEVAEEDAYFEASSKNPRRASFCKFICRSAPVFLLLLFVVAFISADIAHVFYDSALADGTKLTSKLHILIPWAIAIVFAFIARSVLLLQLILRSTSNLFAEAVQRLLGTNLLFFLENPQGQILNRLSKDQSMIDEILPNFMFDFCKYSIFVMITVSLCAKTQPSVVLFLPFIIIPSLYFRAKFIIAVQELKRLEATTRSPCYSLFASTLPGLSSIRCFKSEGVFLKRYVKYQNFNGATSHAFLFTSRWFAFRIDLCALLFLSSFLALICLNSKYFYGDFVVFLVWPGSVTLGTSAAGLALSKCTGLLGILQWTIRVFSEVQTLMTSVERVEEYTRLPLEESPAATERALPVPKDWPSKGHVRFSSVSLQYPNCPKNVLNNLSLEFAPGQKIAVVGRTGAGKSSLVSAIFRILEPSPVGSLQIDNVNISAISLGVLRSRIAIIPQDPFLFKGTIRFNLDPFEQHTDDQLWDALRRAEVQEIVQEIPQRLEAEVQEGGANFSVGERQLFCLARAILRQPRVIVMDEATANIDIVTTEKIIRAMENSFKHATVITIVHRLHTIMEYDRVLVLEKGEVGEFDSPFNLLSRQESLFGGMVAELGDDAVRQMKEVARLSDVRKGEVAGE